MFQEQIEKGAKLLDEKLPEWLEKQKLSKLNLRMPCNCILGQAYPEKNYSNALWDLFPGQYDQLQASIEHGFSINNKRERTDEEDTQEWRQLTNEWKSYIIERRKQHS